MWTWGYILQQVIVGSGLIWRLYMLYVSFIEILGAEPSRTDNCPEVIGRMEVEHARKLEGAERDAV